MTICLENVLRQIRNVDFKKKILAIKKKQKHMNCFHFMGDIELSEEVLSEDVLLEDGFKKTFY